MSRNVRCWPRLRGFTLLEVMVALFILAVAAAALSRVVSQSTDTTSQLELRQKAQWVAHNQLSLLMLGAEDDLDGEVTFAHQTFHWKAARSKAQLTDFERIVISVAEASNKEYTLATLTGFMEP